MFCVLGTSVSTVAQVEAALKRAIGKEKVDFALDRTAYYHGDPCHNYSFFQSKTGETWPKLIAGVAHGYYRDQVTLQNYNSKKYRSTYYVVIIKVKKIIFMFFVCPV